MVSMEGDYKRFKHSLKCSEQVYNNRIPFGESFLSVSRTCITSVLLFFIILSSIISGQFFSFTPMPAEAITNAIIPAKQQSIPINTDNSSNASICHIAIDPVTGKLYITASNGLLYIFKEESSPNTSGNSTGNGHSIIPLSTIGLGTGSCTSDIMINPRTHLVYVPDAIADSI